MTRGSKSGDRDQPERDQYEEATGTRDERESDLGSAADDPVTGDDEGWSSAEQACELLGIQRATLYAYVSRGLLRSFPGEDARSRRYRRRDLEALAARTGTAVRAARGAIAWGEPVLDSALTRIAEGRFYYRGYEVVALSRLRRFEDVCCLLWLDGRPDVLRGGQVEGVAMRERLFTASGPAERLASRSPGAASSADAWRDLLARLEAGHPVDRLSIALRLTSHADLEASDLAPEAVARCGVRILRCLFAAAGDQAPDDGTGLAATLAGGWGLRREGSEQVLERALILCADHELNVSSFTVRCVASAGATPYDAIDAGLAAIRGWRHGGMSERVCALFAELGVAVAAPSRRRVREVLASRRNTGEWIPGFGHPLYPEGDPRFEALIDVMHEQWGETRVLDWARLVAAEGEAILGRKPNLDLGLATLAVEIGASPTPAATAWLVFALGRTAGWIAHAIEEYERARLIRPRANYVGRSGVASW
jgi:citrate synthase